MADGAMTSAFIPVYTEYRVGHSKDESWDFARQMFWTLAAVMVGFSVLGFIFAPELVRLFTLASPSPEEWDLAVLLTRITFPFCALIALAALAGGILNTFGVFGLPASVPIYQNLAIIVAAVLAWGMGYHEPAVALALGFLIGGILQVAVQIPALVRRGMPFGFKLSFTHPGIRRVAALMMPAFAGVGLYQLNVLISTIFASQSKGWISALYYADRIMEVVLGGYAISVATVVLPLMSRQAVQKDFGQLRETLTFSLRTVAFIVVPAAAGLIAVGGPIVRLLFEHKAFSAASTELTASALLFYAVGLPAFASVRMVVQGFYATQDTATPVRVTALALTANVIFCVAFVGPLGHRGLALATSLASYVNLVLLYWIFRRRLGHGDEGRLALSFVRTVTASLGMAVGCWWLAERLALMTTESFAVLVAGAVATIAVGVVLYFALAWVLRAEELAEVYTLVTGRKPGARLSALRPAVPLTPNHK